MIFVNDPGDWSHLYRPFDHAEWHGWTFTDLIFPFFLFIVGTAGVLSLERREAGGATRRELARHAFVRGMTIVLVGWAMAWYPFGVDRLLHLRIFGVLPRIGVVYVLGTWILLALPKERRATGVAVACVFLLAAHTALLFLPGYDLTREGNVQRAVDLALLKGHTWKKDWDPEGIVSTLTALATMLTGTLAGFLLKSERPMNTKALALAAWGVVGIAIGQLAHFWLPINKNLWTGSYVLLTSGFAALLLGLSVLVISKGVVRPFAFFITFGKNPLLVFVLSGLLAKTLGLIRWTGASGKPTSLHAFLFHHGFDWIPDLTLRSHAWALVYVIFWWAVMKALEKRGWFWRV